MAIFENSPDFEMYLGEYMGDLGDAIAEYVPSCIQEAQSLLPNPEHKLVSKGEIEGAKFEVPSNNFTIERTEEAGKFRLHLKEEIVGHKGRTAVITGTAALLLGASYHLAHQKKHHK